jgi:hypothetical protein
MLWLDELRRRLRMWSGREQFDRDLQEEMRLHIDLRGQEQVERGLPPDEARAAAQRRFGNSTLLRELSRDAWGWTWLEQFAQDIRYGVRNMLRTPGFTLVAARNRREYCDLQRGKRGAAAAAAVSRSRSPGRHSARRRQSRCRGELR